MLWSQAIVKNSARQTLPKKRPKDTSTSDLHQDYCAIFYKYHIWALNLQLNWIHALPSPGLVRQVFRRHSSTRPLMVDRLWLWLRAVAIRCLCPGRNRRCSRGGILECSGGRLQRGLRSCLVSSKVLCNNLLIVAKKIEKRSRSDVGQSVCIHELDEYETDCKKWDYYKFRHIIV